MRTFFLTIFWFSNFCTSIWLLFMASASWIIFSGAYSFSELSLNVFLTQYVPWLLWLKIFIIALLGEFGTLVLATPVLVIAPLKFVAGTIIGLWAYSAAKKIPVEPAYT